MKRGTTRTETNLKMTTILSKALLHPARCLIMMKATRIFNVRR